MFVSVHHGSIGSFGAPLSSAFVRGWPRFGCHLGCRCQRPTDLSPARSLASSPSGDDHLLARVELDSIRPFNMEVTVERPLPTAEREESEGLRDRDIDADDSSLDSLTEFPGSSTRLSENRGHVA